jgi:putative sigma-54 modulation protein
MQVDYTGRQVTITKSLRALAEEAAERISTILGKTIDIHVILTKEKYRQMAEVTVKTRLQTLVGAAESSNLDTALREALERVETQAVRYKDRMRERKRQPKDGKHTEEPELARPRRGTAAAQNGSAPRSTNGTAKAFKSIKVATPVTVHSFPARVPIPEPHVVRSSDSVAIRPMTLEEAVKEAEFRDRDVFVFRDMEGNVNILHRKRDGKMELIEVP